MTWAKKRQLSPEEERRHKVERVTNAGLAGATAGSLPAITMKSIAENLEHDAPAAMHRFGKDRYALAGGLAGLAIAGTASAFSNKVGPKTAVPALAGGGAGDAIGGLAGGITGNRIATAAMKSMPNPSMRIAGAVAASIAGDTAGGAAGNLIGGRVAQKMQQKPGLFQKSAALLPADAPMAMIRNAAHFKSPTRIPDMSATAITRKALNEWSPSGPKLDNKFFVPPANRTHQFVMSN